MIATRMSYASSRAAAHRARSACSRARAGVNAIGASVGDLAAGQAHLLDVQPGLELAQHDVVDALLVAEPRRTVARLRASRASRSAAYCCSCRRTGSSSSSSSVVHDVQVLLVLAAGPLDHVGVGAELGGHLGQRGQRRLGGLASAASRRSSSTEVSCGSRAQRTTRGQDAAPGAGSPR